MYNLTARGGRSRVSCPSLQAGTEAMADASARNTKATARAYDSGRQARAPSLPPTSADWVPVIAPSRAKRARAPVSQSAGSSHTFVMPFAAPPTHSQVWQPVHASSAHISREDDERRAAKRARREGAAKSGAPRLQSAAVLSQHSICTHHIKHTSQRSLGKLVPFIPHKRKRSLDSSSLDSYDPPHAKKRQSYSHNVCAHVMHSSHTSLDVLSSVHASKRLEQPQILECSLLSHKLL